MKTTPLIPKELIKLVENFKSEVFNKHELPNHKCFCISYPLSLYFQIHNYENKLIRGKLRNSTPTSTLRHFWIELSTGTIVDLTIEQFLKQLSAEELPLIFPKNYNESRNNLSVREHNNWFEVCPFSLDKSLKVFKTYFNRPSLYLCKKNIKTGFDLRDFLRISLKAAIIINREIDKRRVEINENYLTYFSLISYMIDASNNTDLSLVISEFENNEGYQNLISKINTM